MSNSNRPTNPYRESSSAFPSARRFPMLRIGTRISLGDGTRATIAGTGSIIGGNGAINLLYIVMVDAAAAHILVNIEHIDADGRFIR